MVLLDAICLTLLVGAHMKALAEQSCPSRWKQRLRFPTAWNDVPKNLAHTRDAKLTAWGHRHTARRTHDASGRGLPRRVTTYYPDYFFPAPAAFERRQNLEAGSPAPALPSAPQHRTLCGKARDCACRPSGVAAYAHTSSQRTRSGDCGRLLLCAVLTSLLLRVVRCRGTAAERH